MKNISHLNDYANSPDPCGVNPRFRARALNMLSGWFGYDREELEGELAEYELCAMEDGEHAIEGLKNFLICAIENDLNIEPKEV